MRPFRYIQAARVVHDRTSWRPVLHRHQHHELVFVTTGHYDGLAAGRPVSLPAGSGMICQAGVEHGCNVACVGDLGFLILQWDGPSPPKDAGTFADQATLVEHPLARLAGIAEAPGHAARSLRDHLTAVVVQEALWLADPDDAPPPAEDPADRVREHLDRVYAAPLDLDHLAIVAGTSRSTLTRRFRARYGISPIRYLQDLRLHHARHLVTTTALPMATIAERVGFLDPLHLGRLLKRATGKTVHELRRGRESR